jgi:hypothetical protein
MDGLVTSIHAFVPGSRRKAWMAGTRPAMTRRGCRELARADEVIE